MEQVVDYMLSRFRWVCLMYISLTALIPRLALSQNTSLISINQHLYQVNPALMNYEHNKWNFNNTLTTLKTGANTNLYTYTVSGDFNIIHNSHQIGVGLYASQKSIIFAPLKENRLGVNFTYGYMVNGHKFSIGIQPGIFSKSLLFDKVTFPDQYDRETGWYNTDQGTYERMLHEKTTVSSLIAGVSYSNLIKHLHTGISVLNITQPDVSFGDYPDKTPLQVASVFSVELPINLINKLQPFTFLLFDAEMVEWTLGGSYLFKSPMAKKTFLIGAFYKYRSDNMPNDLVCQVGYRFDQMEVMLGYDKPVINASYLPRNWQRFEIALRFYGVTDRIINPKAPCYFF